MTGVSECSQQRSNLKDDGYSKINRHHLKNNSITYIHQKNPNTPSK
ncbi:hypothetical protein [Photorhabdus bodei]|uniref:Transposase n=1 Tax=Photorhabdus bodei TaxID=2029681 RepID=A0ABX0AI76_9GAMM|nr:hypothetical protein [Photorhabdus bodei]NDK98441.1 hypothetical protein [Photorhabdus bodei]NDL02693.1 hypothetical protein [Photorhabdus bodei]NDL06825.1 hypothetical protein [Photorhabdus bodei]